MKIVLAALIFSLSPIRGFSSENTKTCEGKFFADLYVASMEIVAEAKLRDAKILKLFVNPDYPKTNLETLKKQVIAIGKESHTREKKLVEKMDAILKAHPECQGKLVETESDLKQ